MELDVALLLGAVIAGIATLYWYVTDAERRRFVALINRLPGPPTVPFLGNALEEMQPRNKIMDMVRARNAKYAPLYRSWSGNMAEIHITKAEHVEIILGSTKHVEKSWAYRFLHPWLGLGLLNSSGAKWHARRKMITPTFHFKILESFMEVFVEMSHVLVEKLGEEVKLRGGAGFDVHPFITRCALDIICQTAMGTDIRAQQETHSEYVRAIADISGSFLQRAIRPWLHADFIYNRCAAGRDHNHMLNVLHGFTIQVIQERKAERLKAAKVNSKTSKEDDNVVGAKKRLAFLDLLLDASQDGNQLSDMDLREEVDTFMFEGHDTTTAGVGWALLLLGANPDVQEKAISELDDIFGGSDRPITMRDLTEMKYLECVIKEALRLYPSVAFIGRALKEDTQIGDYLIPADPKVTINIHIFDIHRDPDYFPSPEKFNPDHFLPERVQGRHPYAYIPFSAGPRNCIGQKFAMMEEKTMIAAVLRRFRLQAMEKVEEVTLISELILKPESGVQLVLTPR